MGWGRSGGFAVAFAAAVAAAAGCSRAAAAPASPSAGPPARVFEPPGLAPGERRPLLILLHGLGGSADEMLAQPGLGSLGQLHRLFVIAPDGTIDRQGRRFWNAGPACCDFDRTGIDDVARLTALIDRWRRHPGVDPRRVYLLGFSNGGFLAHRLACRIGDRLAAVVSIAGAGVGAGEACAMKSEIGVLEIHGDADPIVRPQGGRVFDMSDLAPFPGMEATLTDWARRLGCGTAAVPTTATLDLDPRIAGNETVVRAYRACRLGDAELWTVRGGDHALGTPAMFEEAWRFLQRRVKPGL
jgi:polyhydroxybutyrate depolymerase